jgi:hypothetical protein
MAERTDFSAARFDEWVDDWQIGRRISTLGVNKIVLAAGMLSRSGEAMDRFGGFLRYLVTNHGYEPGDFLEASYNTRQDAGDWRPAPYDTAHCEASLTEATTNVGRSLRWYRSQLPDDTRYHLIGYSLGGVALFESAGALLFGEPDRWEGRIGSLTTLAAPLFGTDLGLEGELLGALGLGTLLPSGKSVRQLIERGGDPRHRAVVERLAERLRGQGVSILTLADANDVVVTASDSVIAPSHERDWHVLDNRNVVSLSGGGMGVPLGHGPLLNNTLAWVRIAKMIGRQQPRD